MITIDMGNPNKKNLECKPRYAIAIFTMNGKYIKNPHYQIDFLKILKDPLHYKRIIFEQPTLYLSLLWRHNHTLFTDNKIDEKCLMQRMAQTILLLSSKSHNVWQYFGAIESLNLILLLIWADWICKCFEQIELNINDLSSIIFSSHIQRLYKNKAFKQCYIDFQNGRCQNEIKSTKKTIKSALTKLSLIELTTMTRYFKLLSYNKIKCGNINCNKNYLKDQYHLEISIIDYDKLSQFLKKNVNEYLQKLYNEWKNKVIYNEWRICKNCKRVKYCSKKCQKISWNKQNHRKYCNRYHIQYSTVCAIIDY